MAEELPVGYYLDNFLTLLSFVQQQYPDLLTSEENDYADAFRRLRQDSQRLYVRLISRRGPLFRSDKLRYEEIGDPDSAIAELRAAGYLDLGEDEELTALLAVLTKPDLLELLEGEGLRSWRRAELVALAEELLDVCTLRERLPFRILRPLLGDRLQLYRLLFFGNLSQDLTEFVLTDLGVLTYEDYPVPRSARAFQSREAVETVILLRELAEESDAILEGESGLTLTQLLDRLPPASDDEMVARRRDRLLNRIGRQLERDGDLDVALSAYECAGSARERRCRIMERTGRLPEALRLAEEMLATPMDEEERELALRFIPRLRRKLSMARVDLPTGRLRESEFSDSLRLPPAEGVRVEECVLRHLEEAGAKAYYVENRLFLGLFGLTFWDAIFRPVRGAFFNRYQSGPADLYSPRFSASRAEIIDARLHRIESEPSWRDEVWRTFEAKLGIANPFVQWQHLTEEILTIALERIPSQHLLHVFRRLLFDLRNHRSGFPDLISFPPEGSYLLIEVKGPGDRLQENQKRWIRAFRDAGMPVRVANVEWQ